MRKTVFRDLARTTSTRIINKTNGITFRRWLFEANQPLTQLLIATVGDRVLDEPGRLLDLGLAAEDETSCGATGRHARETRRSSRTCCWRRPAFPIDPEAMFDVHDQAHP